VDQTSSPPSPPNDLRAVQAPAQVLASFARVLAHRPGEVGPTTSVTRHGVTVPGWEPPADLLRRYAEVVGSTAVMPLAFPAVVVTQLYRDLLGAGGMPVNGMGLVHVATRLWTAGPLPVDGPWQVSAWVEGARHTRSGLEIDLGARCAAGGAEWTSLMVVLARSSAARGSDPSGAPDLPEPGENWGQRTPLDAPADVGRRYAAVSGDFNPIHLHTLTAKPFGFARAIAHGWWVVPRALALLGVDETPDDTRQLEVAYARPVLLPSHLTLRATTEGDAGAGDAGRTTTFVALRADGKPHFGGRLKQG
jgi:acyl dehydratase